MSTGKVGFWLITEKGRIRASARKVESGRVPEKGRDEYKEVWIWASTKKGRIREGAKKVESGRVLEKGPSEYREGWI